jgi:hypothetical protein
MAVIVKVSTHAPNIPDVIKIEKQTFRVTK